jgi:hypothetical protein
MKYAAQELPVILLDLLPFNSCVDFIRLKRQLCQISWVDFILAMVLSRTPHVHLSHANIYFLRLASTKRAVVLKKILNACWTE